MIDVKNSHFTRRTNFETITGRQKERKMKKAFSVDLTMNDEKIYLLLEGDEKGALTLED